MSRKIEASQAEWEVLRVVWSVDKATSKNVSEVLKETQNWENATTKTLLGRLVKKGYLKTHKEGNRFVYEATIDEQEGVNNRLLELTDTFCSQSRGVAIAELIRQYKLSKEDKRMIEEAMAQKEFFDTLECTCLSSCTCEANQCKCGHHHQHYTKSTL